MSVPEATTGLNTIFLREIIQHGETGTEMEVGEYYGGGVGVGVT